MRAAQAKLWQSVYCKSNVFELLGGFGRYRKNSEEVIQMKGKKWAVIWVGLAYRELIGSLYESWTIGIEKVYKQLINNTIQQR